MKEYNMNVNLCIGSTIVFVNGNLKMPGVDFVFDDRSQYEGTYLVFRNSLNDHDTLCVQDSLLAKVFWFVVRDGELVDISNDKTGYSGNEWITL